MATTRVTRVVPAIPETRGVMHTCDKGGCPTGTPNPVQCNRIIVRLMIAWKRRDPTSGEASTLSRIKCRRHTSKCRRPITHPPNRGRPIIHTTGTVTAVEGPVALNVGGWPMANSTSAMTNSTATHAGNGMNRPNPGEHTAPQAAQEVTWRWGTRAPVRHPRCATRGG